MKKYNLIICQICQKEMFKDLKGHIKKYHQEITTEEYIKQNWENIPLYNPCVICKEKIVYKYQTCSKECHSILISNKLKGVSKPEGFITEDHKQILRERLLGKPGLFTGYHRTEEEKRIQSEKMIGKKNHLGHKQSDYQKSQASKNLLAYYAAGNEPWTKNNKHAPETIEKIFKKRKANKLEKFVSEFLDQNNIEYNFQFFLSRNGVCKSYDFKIKNTNILIEIDGDFWHGNPNTKNHFFKLEEVRENDKFKDNFAKENGFILIRLWESDFYKNPQILINKIKESECL